jgi:hypothetical protein
MNKFLTNSTAAQPLGIPTGRKCQVVKNGQYLNRLAIIYAASESNIALVWADPPYDNFSTPINVVTDSADSPFDVFMGQNNDIYLAYTISSNKNLGFVKLDFSDGLWSAGSPVIVYDSDENYFPSICLLSSDYLWVAYTRLSGGTCYISAKSSTDGGQSWGTVSNPGDTLTSGTDSAYSIMLEAGDYQYVFYSEGGTKIAYRRKLNTGIIWNSEIILASGSGFGEDLAADVDRDDKVGLAYVSATGLKFREYSGSAWSGESVLDENPVKYPAVSYQGGIPYVIFKREYGVNMELAMYTRRVETAFQSPAPLDERKSYFQKLLVYDASAGTYQDKTGAASSTDTADLFHSVSGGLLKSSGDAIFLGMNEPFHFINLILSTVGSGGNVVWKYWDGQAWKSFTPYSGAWHFTTTNHGLLLWNDFNSIPNDWQKKTISENNFYWIAATADSPFNTAPIGTQITAAPNLKSISVQV